MGDTSLLPTLLDSQKSKKFGERLGQIEISAINICRGSHLRSGVRLIVVRFFVPLCR